MSNGPILVVDDDQSHAELIREWLEQQGLQVDLASNGKVALEQAARRRPSLILLDLIMPVMTGYEFLRHLWASETLQDVPVVVISGAHVTNLGGTVGFLRKPINLGELLRVVAPYRPATVALAVSPP
ncbi:MAG: response regulator [Myxococcota bacterium]|nr:response regulator [Myxococcota bacterium]